MAPAAEHDFLITPSKRPRKGEPQFLLKNKPHFLKMSLIFLKMSLIFIKKEPQFVTVFSSCWRAYIVTSAGVSLR